MTGFGHQEFLGTPIHDVELWMASWIFLKNYRNWLSLMFNFNFIISLSHVVCDCSHEK